MNTVKYPEVNVELIGGDDNAFAILGKVARKLRRAKVPPGQIAGHSVSDRRGGVGGAVACGATATTGATQ